MHLRRVKDYNSRMYAEVIAILREAIAPEAQLTLQRFHDLLAAANYQLFVYVQGEDVHGFALLYFSDALPFAWLDYFAIRCDRRGRGLGSELFREIVQIARKQRDQPDWLLFEVDDDYQGDVEREAECKRRVQFYRRLGAGLLENVRYKFPSAFAAPIRMQLMCYQIRHDAKLEPEYLKQAVREIFSSIHGRGIDDGLLRWFEEGLPRIIEMK